ncbi:MAG: histidine kinase, partial [Planctomycetota bacterium]
REERRLSVAQARAARLEAELLKKHLQPHFLMNTLTSIMEWVETDPPRGARAMESLSSELRTLVDISGETLIPMSVELDLCRAHLSVMEFRQGVSVELDVEGVNGDELIPPAVIHTLIENALTHNAYGEGAVRFRLAEKKAGRDRRIVLRTPLAGSPRRSRPEGGGLRYVRTRLEESFPGAWSIQSGAEDGEWWTRIHLSSQSSGYAARRAETSA